MSVPVSGRQPTKIGWVLRDMMQSTGIWTFDSDAIGRLATSAAQAGFSHLEVGGGQSFQIALQNHANPYRLIAATKKQLDAVDATLPLQVLLRGANQFGFHHFAQSIQQKNLDLLVESGGDADPSRALIIRIFDALNDIENLRYCIEYLVAKNISARKIGEKQVTLQIALSYVAPASDEQGALYSANYYVAYANKLRDIAQQAGGDINALCIKDMSGQLDAVLAAELVTALQTLGLPVTLHCHSTDEAKSLAAILAAAQNGVTAIEVALQPLTGGASHHNVHNVLGFSFVESLNLQNLTMLEAQCNDLFKVQRDERKDFQLPLASLKSLCALGVPGGAIPFIVHDLQEQVCAMLGLNLQEAIEAFSEELDRLQSQLGRLPLVTPTADIIAKQAIKNMGNRTRPEKYKMMDPRFCSLVLGQYGESINHATGEKIKVANELVNEVVDYIKAIEPNDFSERIKSGKHYPEPRLRATHPSLTSDDTELVQAEEYVAELASRYPESVERFGSLAECTMMQVMQPAGNNERLLTRNILGPTEQRLRLLLARTLYLLPAQRIPEAREQSDNETTDFALLDLLGNYEGIINNIKDLVMHVEQDDLQTRLELLKDRVVGSYCEANEEAQANRLYVERRFVALFAAAVFWDLQRICRRTGADSREDIDELTANSLGRIISVTLRTRKEAGISPARSYLV